MQTRDSAMRTFTVGDEDTALALGSGDLRVLGTPRLVAWCEAVTCAALEATIGPGQSSVGTRVQLDHIAASPVGAVLEVRATVGYVDGRLVRLEVVAHQTGPEPADEPADKPADKLVAHGEVTRVVVDRERFLSRLG